ncbi:hypothetical protein SDC9_116372 [bioreactor metagenome]|uniref:Uncharacterized protein n=1 Tax=bioreactor metagenome TaxID=1076179 RepID=A0A645BW61_9ZZZZ
MQHVAAGLEKGLKVADKLFHIHLRGLGVGPSFHRGVKIRIGYAFAQVVRILPAVQRKVEADVVNIAARKMFLRQVGGGTAA